MTPFEKSLIGNLIGCDTYLVNDTNSNRYVFFGLVENAEERIKGATIISLDEFSDTRVIDTFKDNDVDLSNYTHVAVVENETENDFDHNTSYYLLWD